MSKLPQRVSMANSKLKLKSDKSEKAYRMDRHVNDSHLEKQENMEMKNTIRNTIPVR